MYSEVVFQVAEERFNGICIHRDIRTANKLEHIGDCLFQMDVCFPYFVVGIGHLSDLHIDRFLPDELTVLLMQFVKLPDPEYPVIVCHDAVYLSDNPPKPDACQGPRRLRQPGRAYSHIGQ